ncbi:MAG TPA: pilus assembly protein PilM, partial [Gaiellaceae bacterium]|nr:pilus assembly protein PilM [Gaiellaceae bacterium]
MVDWKKEIKLSDLVGGKKQQQNATAPEAVEVVEQSDQPEQSSFWKKEVTFGRKAKPDGEPKTSIWKKELSFGRKQQPTDESADETPDTVETSPKLEPDVPAAVELIQSYLPEPAATVAPVPPEPHVELVPDPVEQVFPVAVPDLEPEPAVQFLDLLAGPPAEPVAPEPLPVAESPAPTAPAPAPVVETPAPPSPPAPLPASVAEAVVVHPPVSAAQLPPLPPEPEPKAKKSKKKKEKKVEDYDETARVPFYKRNFSFGRKPKDPYAADEPDNVKKPKRRGRSFSMRRPAPRSARPGKLPKRVVGLKIGASQLAAATVSNNGHAEVLQLAREALDSGIVSNGELREPELLAEALKAFFKRHKLPKRGVRLGIATNRIGVRTLEISGIEDAKQLANAIKFRAQEALPIPIDEAVLDYQVLSVAKNEEGETTRR